jgi:hypothetical protein
MVRGAPGAKCGTGRGLHESLENSPALALGDLGVGGATRLNAIFELSECVKFGEGVAKLQSTSRNFSDPSPISRDRFKDLVDHLASFKISRPVNAASVLVFHFMAAPFQLCDHQVHAV